MMRHCRTILILILLLTNNFSWAQKVMYFSFNEENGSNTAQEDIQNIAFNISNHFSRAERVLGVEGNALRLDGFSTFIEKSGYQLSSITNKLTIEAWYATESFAPRNAALVSQDDNTNGFSLSIGSYGHVVFSFSADNSRYTIQTSQRIKPYQWNHIVAFIDLTQNTASIFVNGAEWASKNLEPHQQLTFITQPFYIGRHSNTATEHGLLAAALNGALDELSIYQNILSPAQILTNYQQYQSATLDLTIDPDYRHAGDHLRPRYHSMPNTSWTNEPYGLIHYKDKYHLFFQKNPNGPDLYFMHWGHLSSPDLVNWTEEEIPIRPDPGFDHFGVWSGTTIKDPNGVPVIYYTGVNGQKAGIGMALPQDDDLIKWNKVENNPLIPNPPAGYQHMDFRDPFLYKRGDTYYMIVGSGLTNDRGGILFHYKSTDMVNWSAILPLYRHGDINVSGTFWEMPYFVQLNEKDWMLQVTPLYKGQRARCIYWIGEIVDDRFQPYDETPESFELITENFLSPSIAKDEYGNWTYIGILAEDRNADDQVRAGWRHTFSLPREIRLLEDTVVGHIPHRNLCRLRTEHTRIKDRTLNPGTNFNLPEFGGNQVEVQFKIKADSASRFTIQFFKHADTQELTSVIFDLENNAITLDKRFSTMSNALKNSKRSDYVFDYKDSIEVRAFLDHSVLEIFIDQLLVFSTRVYPSRVESDKIDLIVNKGSIVIGNLDQWVMSDMNGSGSESVCEPENLPSSLRYLEKPPVVEVPTGLKDEEGEFKMSVTPIPVHDQLHIVLEGNTTSAEVQLISSQGQLLKKNLMRKRNEYLDMSALPAGVYLLKVRFEKGERVYRIVKL